MLKARQPTSCRSRTTYAVLAALLAWFVAESDVRAQSCTAAGGTLGPNLLTAESNGTYGVGTGQNQVFQLQNPSVTTYPFDDCGATIGLGYPPDDGCYAVTTQRTLSSSPPANPNGGFGTWHRHAGHTTGASTDKYLVVNAALAPGVFYRQEISGLTRHELRVRRLGAQHQRSGFRRAHQAESRISVQPDRRR